MKRNSTAVLLLTLLAVFVLSTVTTIHSSANAAGTDGYICCTYETAGGIAYGVKTKGGNCSFRLCIATMQYHDCYCSAPWIP